MTRDHSVASIETSLERKERRRFVPSYQKKEVSSYHMSQLKQLNSNLPKNLTKQSRRSSSNVNSTQVSTRQTSDRHSPPSPRFQSVQPAKDRYNSLSVAQSDHTLLANLRPDFEPIRKPNREQVVWHEPIELPVE